MTSDPGDRVTFDRLSSGRRGLLRDHALAQLTAYLMPIVLVAVECWSHVVVRKGESPEVPAQHPDPQGWRLTRTTRLGHLVEASAT